MSQFDTIANDEQIRTTVAALKKNGFNVTVVDTLSDAKTQVLQSIPEGAQIFTATSRTIEDAGLDETLNKPPYVSMRNAYMKFYGQPEKAIEMKQIGSASDVTTGSAHALTEDGKILVASRTGSQIPNYAYGASKIFLVVGAQKLVKDLATGIQRIEEYVVPLEDVRAQQAYGIGTRFNKLLVFNNEDNPERITVIIVKEKVGF